MSTIKLHKRPSKKFMIVLLALAVAGSFLFFGHVAALQGTVKNQQLELKSTEVQLDKQQDQLAETKETLQKVQVEKDTTAEKAQKLEQEKKDLEAQLQAKLEAKAKVAAAEAAAREVAVAASTAPVEETYSAPVARSAPARAASVGGGKAQWMAAAGISAADYNYVDYIVERESSWNPNAVNPNGGACGLGQQLPCGKWAGAWNDPVAALVAMQGYAIQRYGSWANAYAFWTQNHWW